MLMRWGDRYLAGPEGAPLVLRHHDCGEIADPALVCGICDKDITPQRHARTRTGIPSIPPPAPLHPPRRHGPPARDLLSPLT